MTLATLCERLAPESHRMVAEYHPPILPGVQARQDRAEERQRENRENHYGSREYVGARARADRSGRCASTIPPIPAPVTILKCCRCVDCRLFEEEQGGFFCAAGIGGTKVNWATGEHRCEPAPESWHYCAAYHGPLKSGDIWVWPRSTDDAGPTGTQSEGTPGRNGRAACLFRSTVRTDRTEAKK